MSLLTLFISAVVVTPKTSSDEGSGADVKITGNPLVIQVRTETGGGVENLRDRDTVLTEVGFGQDVLAQVEAILDRVEAGTGLDALLYRDLVATELGAGTETLALLVAILKAETGLGLDALVELITPIIARLGSDGGIGIDTKLLLALLADTDVAIALDKANLFTGRRIILNVGFKPYRDLVVTTKPYRDLKMKIRGG